MICFLDKWSYPSLLGQLKKYHLCEKNLSPTEYNICPWVHKESRLHINKLYLIDLTGKVTNHYGLEIFISFFKNIFIYLVVLSLGCRMQNLCCGMRAPEFLGSVAVTHGLSCSLACGILLPWSRSNLCPLCGKVDS